MQANSIAQAVLFCCLLLVAAVWDIQKRMLPDSICILIFLSGLLSFNPENLWGALFALPFFLATLIDQKSMGGGDIKLMASLGLWLGTDALIFVAAAGSIFGGLSALVLLLLGKKKRKSAFAYGPYFTLTTLALLLIRGL